MATAELVIVLDRGGPGARQLARRVRDLKVFSKVLPLSALSAGAEDLKATHANRLRGVIVAGSAAAPKRGDDPDGEKTGLSALDVPVLDLPDGEIDDGDLRSFLYDGCGCTGRWTMANYAEQAVADIRRTVGEDTVLCGLSGGVDSAVAATLVHKAVGDQLVSIFVDHGLLRKNEAEQVATTFREQFNMRLVSVDATDAFLSGLRGVTDPEAKRKIIGERFIRTFEEEARKLGDARWLVQGTLYTDIIESGGGGGQMVKSHHNVGGLPEDMDLDLLEPLKYLFKDEVRALGTVLGLPDAIVQRHPFPGPGLAIRIVGEVTRERLDIVREADFIVLDEIRRAGLEEEVFQAFAALTDTRTVGVTDQERTYGYMLGVRAVTGADGLDAQWARLPHDVLERIASRVMAQLPAVNRVVYDISSKPPATIEWE